MLKLHPNDVFIMYWAGRIGMGKTSSANYARKLFHHLTMPEQNFTTYTDVMSFADSLRFKVTDEYKIDYKLTTTAEGKNTELLYRPAGVPNTVQTVRHALQYTGETYRKEYGHDYWAQDTLKRMWRAYCGRGVRAFFIDDVRYPNEAVFLRNADLAFASAAKADNFAFYDVHRVFTYGVRYVAIIDNYGYKDDGTLDEPTAANTHISEWALESLNTVDKLFDETLVTQYGNIESYAAFSVHAFLNNIRKAYAAE